MYYITANGDKYIKGRELITHLIGSKPNSRSGALFISI
jgi:hypothetical protein